MVRLKKHVDMYLIPMRIESNALQVQFLGENEDAAAGVSSNWKELISVAGQAERGLGKDQTNRGNKFVAILKLVQAGLELVYNLLLPSSVEEDFSQVIEHSSAMLSTTGLLEVGPAVVECQPL